MEIQDFTARDAVTRFTAEFTSADADMYDQLRGLGAFDGPPRGPRPGDPEDTFLTALNAQRDLDAALLCAALPQFAPVIVAALFPERA